MLLLPILPLLLGGGRADVVVPCPSAPGTCITVAGSVPLSGWAAPEGLAMYRGALLWAEATNAAAGLQLVAAARRRSIELRLFDDQSRQGNTQAIYERLVSTSSPDHADFLLGPFGTSFASRAAAVTQAAGKLLVLGNTAGDSAYPRGWTNGSAPALYTFGVVTTGAEYTASAVDALVAAGASTAAVVSRSDNAFAADIAGGLMAILTAHPAVALLATAHFDGALNASAPGGPAAALPAMAFEAMAAACAPEADVLFIIGQRQDALPLLDLMDSGGASCRPRAVVVTSGPGDVEWVAEVNQGAIRCDAARRPQTILPCSVLYQYLVSTRQHGARFRAPPLAGHGHLADRYRLLSAAQWVPAGSAPVDLYTDPIFGGPADFAAVS
eukprot:SAG22_NODE_218_length_14885_cov_24.733699_9_plen_384_part_00